MRFAKFQQRGISQGKTVKKRWVGGNQILSIGVMNTQIINSWKINIFPVSADTAKAEFDRIYDKYGVLTTKDIVDESRDETAALHKCFEWNDEVAAEKYRQRQAGEMIRCLVSVIKHDDSDAPIAVRAIVKTDEKYEPITVTMRSEQKTAVLLADALNDIDKFRKKYAAISELSGVFSAMSDFVRVVSV